MNSFDLSVKILPGFWYGARISERKCFCRIFCFRKITLCQTRRTILHDESVSVINFLTRRKDSRFCGPLLSGLQLRWAVRYHRCVSEVSFYIFVRGASFTIRFGFCVRVSSRIGYNRKGFCLRKTVPSSFFFGSGTLLISGCIVVDHPF